MTNEAKERATCSQCLARTYRGNEDCLCPDGGDAEDFDEVMQELATSERTDGMNYDIRTRPEQLKAVAEWAEAGEGMADVELAADDRMLVASQGDERAAWDLGGEPGSADYIAKAPLDPVGRDRYTETLALYFTPGAIRDHFDGDDDETAEAVRRASDADLRRVGEFCIGADTLYSEFARLLREGVEAELEPDEHTARMAAELEGAGYTAEAERVRAGEPLSQIVQELRDQPYPDESMIEFLDEPRPADGPDPDAQRDTAQDR